jgi:hypothetical protein
MDRKSSRFVTVLSYIIPLLIALFLSGNAAALEKHSWTEDGEMLAAKVIDDQKARHTRFIWEGMRLLQEIGPTPDAAGRIEWSAD